MDASTPYADALAPNARAIFRTLRLAPQDRRRHARVHRRPRQEDGGPIFWWQDPMKPEKVRFGWGAQWPAADHVSLQISVLAKSSPLVEQGISRVFAIA